MSTVNLAETTKSIQRKVGVTADGKWGPMTAEATALALDVDVVYLPEQSGDWPTDTFDQMEAFYGPHGEVDLEKITPPYQLYYDGEPVATISVHKKIAAAVLRILQRTLEFYGENKIREYHLDVYDGCYNDRKKTGGSSWSTHAYAAALDFAAEWNAYDMDSTTALFAQPQYKEWFQFWKEEGAVCLGPDHDFDYMHTQFANVP